MLVDKATLQEQLEAAQAIGDTAEITKIQAQLNAILIGSDDSETKPVTKTEDVVKTLVSTPKPSRGLVGFASMADIRPIPYKGLPEDHVGEILHLKVLSHEPIIPVKGSNKDMQMTIVNGSIWVKGLKPQGSNCLAMISRVGKNKQGEQFIYWNPAGFMLDSELVSLEDKANFIARSSNEAAAMALATLFS